jgi:general secretion pathway protein F
MIKIHTASFSRTLGALLKNGVALLPSIAIARETLADTLLSDLLVEVSESVKSGLGLSKPLNDTGFFPSLAMQMIRLGEESAQLPEMLEKISHIYDAEVKTSVQRLLALLEPVLIIGLGLMIGGIIVSMLMAILSVNDLAF